MDKEKNQNIIKFLKTRRRQWGTERSLEPLSTVHSRPSSKKIAMSRLAIVFTMIFWVLYFLSVIVRHFIEDTSSFRFTLEAYFYLIIVTFLTFSALLYLIMRQGALLRFSKHMRVPRALLEKHFGEKPSTVTVLVPSYDEEPQVIRKTLLSAALQEFPHKRIVLLLDDDASRIKPEKMERFEATRSLAQEINELLAVPHTRFLSAREAYLSKNHLSISGKDIQLLADEYAWAAGWLTDFASKEAIEDHVDVFFVEQVIQKLADDLTLVYEALQKSQEEHAALTDETAKQLYNRLVWLFGVETTVFERKKYISLSHEFNKAMNINSYIGLMGGTYLIEDTPDGLVLTPTTVATEDTITIPDSEYVLTLDADSILLREYCLRLVYFLEQPDNSDVAVTQTPYSAFRGASTRIERLAGATTDIQHILHQGMSYYNATFWVGANAVIRKKALEDIEEIEWVGGYEIKKYVQDNTVIEDTESSIDLALHGWRLVNYPERLSYSATPPDFGSLVVQRRRWANGGLIILAKLFRHLTSGTMGGRDMTSMEFMIRLNYMASIAWSNFGLIFLLAYPYDGRLLSPFVLLAAMPYFIAQASDLRYCGYKYTDILKIYGFNLILLPVNVAGVLKSMEQLLTTKKIPFARTPKVRNRTGVGLTYVLSPIFIVAFSLFTLYRNIDGQNWGNAAVAGFNAITAIWAIVAYIGVWNMFVDVLYGVGSWFYVDVPVKSTVTTEDESDFDWKTVLYHGDIDGVVPHHSLAKILLPKDPKTL